MKGGDLLLRFVEAWLSSVDDLHRQLTGERIGKPVDLLLLRQGERVNVTVEPRELPIF